jgi:hypothetical protein
VQVARAGRAAGIAHNGGCAGRAGDGLGAREAGDAGDAARGGRGRRGRGVRRTPDTQLATDVGRTAWGGGAGDCDDGRTRVTQRAAVGWWGFMVPRQRANIAAFEPLPRLDDEWEAAAYRYDNITLQEPEWEARRGGGRWWRTHCLGAWPSDERRTQETRRVRAAHAGSESRNRAIYRHRRE